MHNVVPTQSVACYRSPWAGILNRYETHLRTERGLVTDTIRRYLPFVDKFLDDRFRGRPFLIKAVNASDISDFVLQHSHSMGIRTAQLMTTSFRSFFRFLLQKGELQADLTASVLTVVDWRLSSVPKYLTPEEVERVLNARDRRMATGRRAYAILLLLARLGLRSGEVVTLWLEDINWRAGEILIRGKRLLQDRMPIPEDVGEALASYLRRDRLPCQTRRAFVCTRAPRRGFAGPSTLTTIVRRALDRANLQPEFKGAHLLRRSLATSMLRCGATMGEIGEVLRHRAPNTTEISRRSTLMACAHWLTAGRWKVHSEATGTGIERLPAHPPKPWVPAPGTGRSAEEFYSVSPDRTCLLHYQASGASLGH